MSTRIYAEAVLPPTHQTEMGRGDVCTAMCLAITYELGGELCSIDVNLNARGDMLEIEVESMSRTAGQMLMDLYGVEASGESEDGEFSTVICHTSVA